MYFRYRINFCIAVLAALAGCGRSHPISPPGPSSPSVANGAVIASALVPGLDHSLSTVDHGPMPMRFSVSVGPASGLFHVG